MFGKKEPASDEVLREEIPLPSNQIQTELLVDTSSPRNVPLVVVRPKELLNYSEKIAPDKIEEEVVKHTEKRMPVWHQGQNIGASGYIGFSGASGYVGWPVTSSYTFRTTTMDTSAWS